MTRSKIHRIHKAGIRVLKAISSTIRIQILNLMLDQGPLSYTETMDALNLDATHDAGRFAYHLKSLLNADLIEPDVETKKYRLTDLGRRVIEITDEIEDKTYKRQKMFVRTSRLMIEEFDRNKIIQSLITEAHVPTDLAQKIARETEKRLQQFKTKYLTAPLIREIVNAVLLEKHYENYRHKLTRLGLPVHEVTRLIKTSKPNVEAIHRTAGSTVIEEYTLLNILPRNISDAHLSGSLHLHNLGSWILKPHELTHDLPCLLQTYKPKTLGAALNTTTNIIRNIATEITGYQNLDNFNVYLAPFIRDVSASKIKEYLHFFIQNLNQPMLIPTTISLDLATEKTGPHTKEIQQLTLLLLETLAEENSAHPLKNPKVVIKIQQETSKSSESETLFYETHKLAARSLLVYFANLHLGNQKNATYTASGLRLASDWHQDWELDTQRTGNLENISLNLPRISFDAKGNEDKFSELLNERLEIVNQALEIKYEMIRKRVGQNLLPYLTQNTNGDQYLRLENSTRTIALLGLNEALQKIIGQKTEDYKETAALTKSILNHITTYAEKHSKKPHTRLATAIIPTKHAAKRLARLDVEKYGWGIVEAQGTKKQPSYSDINTLSSVEKEPLAREELIHQHTPGGHLTLIEINDSNAFAEALVAKTKQLAASNIGFFTYNLAFTYCNHCKDISHGSHPKCPRCSSTSILSLTHF